MENSLDFEEEAIEELFAFIRLVIHEDKVSRTMRTAQAAKWKASSFTSHHADVDSLPQHCFRANYLAYLVHHPSFKDHRIMAGSWPLVTVVLSATHVSPARHIFLNLSYSKTVRKMKANLSPLALSSSQALMLHFQLQWNRTIGSL